MITIHDLNELIQDQFAIFGHLEEHPELRSGEKPLWPEDGRIPLVIAEEEWTCNVGHDHLELTARQRGRTVRIPHRQASPFEFDVRGLTVYLLNKYAGSRVNDIAVENWVIRQAKGDRHP